ncbi:ABC transporter ATP-binding protein [Mariluticola halotolerans]|uniref:ABC transporter ATP-binding protein n=1 Tax=Mariluticola halotolerans TaxID=2909283 RepID=UPI0026E3F91B|nr:ABC transporter ATP-binding protein [Mariluticola halotolerans]UJQ95471.1 ABC transporter ATP-binding protein [Mariluticola halotolerans]
MHDMRKPAMARFDAVGLGYGTKMVFDALDLTLNAGEVTMFCGPNGCGKSTALKALRRLMKAKYGDIFLSGEAISFLSNKRLAREMAMLTQAPSAPEDLLVEQLVGMGRYAHQGRFAGLTAKDREMVDFAMTACNLQELAKQSLGTLSGGQLQRAWLATILAQDAPVILLDEPTNHLDITHQIETLELIRKMNAEEGRTVVLVLHDLNLAARYADSMVMFNQGKVVAQGTPEQVMREEVISDVFAIGCRVISDPVHGKPLCIPYPRETA